MTGFASPGFAHPGFAGGPLAQVGNYLRRLARKITAVMGHEGQPQVTKVASAAGRGSEPAVVKLSDVAALAAAPSPLDKVSTVAADGVGISLRQTTIEVPVLEIGNLLLDPTLVNGLQFFGDLAGNADYETLLNATGVASFSYQGGITVWRLGPHWVPAVPGHTYAFSLDYSIPGGGTLQTFACFMRDEPWSPGEAVETDFSPQAPGAGRASVLATCPPDCSQATIAVWGHTVGNGVITVANFMLDPRGVVVPFADGDSAGWSWQGDANASPSGVIVGQRATAISALAEAQLQKTTLAATLGPLAVASKVQSEASRV